MDALVAPKIRERLEPPEMITVREAFTHWTKATWAHLEDIKLPHTLWVPFMGDWYGKVNYPQWRVHDHNVQSLWERWVFLEGYDY